MSDALAERFARDGFVVVEELAGADEVAHLRRVYDDLFARFDEVDAADRIELAGGGAPLLQILNPERYAPELLETRAYAGAADLARRLLGPDAGPMGNHAILKPPRHGAETPWHQDEAYWHPGFRHRAISVWMPLQPATRENGCMRFVPGSHAGEVVAHRRAGAGHALVVEREVAAAEEVACPIPAGGATVHAARTLHYAGPNATDEPRRALIMAFSLPGEPLAQPRRFPWQDAG